MTRPGSGVTSMGAVGAFLAGRSCPDAIFHVLCRAFGQASKAEEQATVPFSGGIVQHGYQCGMIWGAALAAGAHAHRLLGPGPQAEAAAIGAAQRLVESFRATSGHVDCVDITDTDGSSSNAKVFTTFFLKGRAIGCFRLAARYGPAAYGEIGAALSGGRVEAPPDPVSCSAMLARRMGASERRVVMAAGLAGGIGLSGGACGALGAALWILGLGRIEGGDGRVEFKDPAAADAIDRFMKITDYAFECPEIAGRRFEDVRDHAAYLRGGGCSGIIEALGRSAVRPRDDPKRRRGA